MYELKQQIYHENRVSFDSLCVPKYAVMYFKQ